jgi:hypothetical protein
MNMNKLATSNHLRNTGHPIRSDVIVLAFFFILSLLLILLLNLPWSPRFYSMSIDNGIYAFAGKLITQGEIPYRDYWDNIPPAINYIDAFTFLVASPSQWTIWWLNITWLLINELVLCLIIYKMAGLVPSIISGVLLVLLVMDGNLFSGGNMTEFFSILPQILTVWALYQFLVNRRARWLVVLGVVTAIAFLTKQTAIGLGLSSVVVILGLEFPKPDCYKVFKKIAIIVVSFSVVMAVVLIYWGVNGGLRDFIDQVIIFNIFYTRGGASLGRILLVLRTLVIEHPFMFLMPLIIISYVHLFWANSKRVAAVFQKGRTLDEPFSPSQATYLAGFIGLPINILFIAFSIYNYYHYYTLLIPSVIIIIIYLIDASIKRLHHLDRKWISYSLGLAILTFFSFWLVKSVYLEFPRAAALESLQSPLYGEYPLDEMERYIISQTEPQDVILIWDMHTEIYFRTNTNAPSRFIHPFPLLSASGKDISNFDQFMDDLTISPPKLILAQEFNNAGVPFFDVPDERICPTCLPEVQSGLRALRTYVYANYSVDRYINDWIIYKRIQ